MKCGPGGCAAKAAELEANPPADQIKDVINKAIDDGSFGATLQTNAAETCGEGCGELEGATANPVIVEAGPLVFNTLSPSVSPTSSSPTSLSPSSPSPITKSVSCCQFKVSSSHTIFISHI